MRTQPLSLFAGRARGIIFDVVRQHILLLTREVLPSTAEVVSLEETTPDGTRDAIFSPCNECGVPSSCALRISGLLPLYLYLPPVYMRGLLCTPRIATYFQFPASLLVSRVVRHGDPSSPLPWLSVFLVSGVRNCLRHLKATRSGPIGIWGAAFHLR